METFSEPLALMENPNYRDQRQQCLARLSNAMLDNPLIDIVTGFNKLAYTFTLQCCYGHFVYEPQHNRHGVAALPISEKIDRVLYRIAYIAFCIENSPEGKRFLQALNGVSVIDPEYVQFGSAIWFWERQVNSYVLQVEPRRYKHLDSVTLEYQEALKVEKIRNEFFKQVDEQLHSLMQEE